jgi:hypothetical protein
MGEEADHVQLVALTDALQVGRGGGQRWVAGVVGMELSAAGCWHQLNLRVCLSLL